MADAPDDPRTRFGDESCLGFCATAATATIGNIPKGWHPQWCPKRGGWHIRPDVTWPEDSEHREV